MRFSWKWLAALVLVATGAFATITITTNAPVAVGSVFYAQTADLRRIDAGTMYFDGLRDTANPNIAFGGSSDPMLYRTEVGAGNQATLVAALAAFEAQTDVRAGSGHFAQGIPSYGSIQLGTEDPDPIVAFQEDTTLGGTDVTVASVDGLGYIESTTPFNWAMFVGAGIAVQTYGTVTPTHDTTVVSADFFISAAGTGGSTVATVTVSDGVADCECDFACNASGARSAACTGSCDFAADDPLTLEITDDGDCTGAPVIAGNVLIQYLWQ